MYLNSNKMITDIVKPGMYVNGSYTRLGINQKPGSKYYEVREVQKVHTNSRFGKLEFQFRVANLTKKTDFTDFFCCMYKRVWSSSSVFWFYGSTFGFGTQTKSLDSSQFEFFFGGFF